MEEQPWPLFVTLWISHTVNIDFPTDSAKSLKSFNEVAAEFGRSHRVRCLCWQNGKCLWNAERDNRSVFWAAPLQLHTVSLLAHVCRCVHMFVDLHTWHTGRRHPSWQLCKQQLSSSSDSVWTLFTLQLCCSCVAKAIRPNCLTNDEPFSLCLPYLSEANLTSEVHFLACQLLLWLDSTPPRLWLHFFSYLRLFIHSWVFFVCSSVSLCCCQLFLRRSGVICLRLCPFHFFLLYSSSSSAECTSAGWFILLFFLGEHSFFPTAISLLLNPGTMCFCPSLRFPLGSAGADSLWEDLGRGGGGVMVPIVCLYWSMLNDKRLTCNNSCRPWRGARG